MLYSSWWTTKFLQVRRCRISVTKKNAPEGCLGYTYMYISIYAYIYIYIWGWKTTQLYGDYFINHDMRIDRHEPTRNSIECHFFFSWLRNFSFPVFCFRVFHRVWWLGFELNFPWQVLCVAQLVAPSDKSQELLELLAPLATDYSVQCNLNVTDLNFCCSS